MHSAGFGAEQLRAAENGRDQDREHVRAAVCGFDPVWPAAGFAVSAPPEPIQLAAGSRLEVPVTIAADEMAAGEFLLPFSLLRADGSVELERKIRIEHLGNRTRMVVRAIEDPHVNQRYPTRNWAAKM